jgi:hypothetical protein
MLVISFTVLSGYQSITLRLNWERPLPFPRTGRNHSYVMYVRVVRRTPPASIVRHSERLQTRSNDKGEHYANHDHQVADPGGKESSFSAAERLVR